MDKIPRNKHSDVLSHPPLDVHGSQAAEQSQQRGERRSGHEAIPHFQEAVQKYRQCMAQSPDAETLANAQVLCSEALQLWAKATLAAEEHMPDSEQSISVEREAKQQALQLYAEAVQVEFDPWMNCVLSCYSIDAVYKDSDQATALQYLHKCKLTLSQRYP